MRDRGGQALTTTRAVRLTAVAVVLAVGFAGGALGGRVAGPLDIPIRGGDGRGNSHRLAAAEDQARPRTGHHSLEMTRGGLLASEAGYTLSTPTTVVGGLLDELFQFQILGPDGAPVVGFEEQHERLLHLVVVSRDLVSYFHLHPWLDPDGTWTVDLPALAPSAYQAFASFVVSDGPALTLSVGLLVPGEAWFAPLPPIEPVALVDGYAVTLVGAPVSGTATAVTLNVTGNGMPVVDLEPYLGALGHLVAIRAGDLAYSHVHPAGTGAGAGGPDVPFMLELLAPGDYRLFFDFAHGGAVHTAAFTVHVEGR